MRAIVDTNVLKVANRQTSQASPNCVVTCTHQLRDIQSRGTLVLDDGWYILREYLSNLRSGGQPGVGDAFLKWVLTNWANPHRCELVHISPLDDDPRGCSFAEFPPDPDLKDFDPSDRKFVAVARAHLDHPPILNAVDTDWWASRSALERNGVRVEFLCPEAMPGV